MRKSNVAGTAFKLCLPVALVALAGCQRQHQQAYQRPGPDHGLQEINELVEATKNHASLQPGSNEAGAPIHVDPYPPSAGMTHDDHTAHEKPKN